MTTAELFSLADSVDGAVIDSGPMTLSAALAELVFDTLSVAVERQHPSRCSR